MHTTLFTHALGICYDCLSMQWIHAFNKYILSTCCVPVVQAYIAKLTVQTLYENQPKSKHQIAETAISGR